MLFVWEKKDQRVQSHFLFASVSRGAINNILASWGHHIHTLSAKFLGELIQSPGSINCRYKLTILLSRVFALYCSAAFHVNVHRTQIVFFFAVLPTWILLSICLHIPPTSSHLSFFFFTNYKIETIIASSVFSSCIFHILVMYTCRRALMQHARWSAWENHK